MRHPICPIVFLLFLPTQSCCKRAFPMTSGMNVVSKNWVAILPDGENCMVLWSLVLSQINTRVWQTDGQIVRQTRCLQLSRSLACLSATKLWNDLKGHSSLNDSTCYRKPHQNLTAVDVHFRKVGLYQPQMRHLAPTFFTWFLITWQHLAVSLI